MFYAYCIEGYFRGFLITAYRSKTPKLKLLTWSLLFNVK